MAFINEPIPAQLISAKLNLEWDDKSGNVPKPKIIEANSVEESRFLETPLNINPQYKNIIIVRSDATGEQERLRDLGAKYKDVTFDVVIDLHSSHSKQMMYNIKAEVRRIIHKNMHNFSGYDVCYYRSFTDFAQQNINYWSGMIRCQFISNKVYLDT